MAIEAVIIASLAEEYGTKLLWVIKQGASFQSCNIHDTSTSKNIR
jgi:hypothetical protein